MKNYILTAGLSLVLMSCGPAGTPMSSTTNSNNNGSSSSGSTGGDASAAWNNFSFSANVSGGSSSNYQAVSIDKVNKTITVSLPLPFDSTLAGIIMSQPLPAIRGATVAFGQLPNGTPILTVTLPLASIVKPISGMPTSTLPSGAPLPGMPANAEPSEQVQIGKGRIPAYVYIGQMSIGLFVNTPFDPTLSTHFQLTDNNGNAVGAIYSLPYTSQNHKDGGFFLNVNVPSKYTQLILDNL